MKDAAAEKTKADTEKTNAENADAVFKAPATPALNTAQAAALLATANARMATLNRPLLREATREVVENNAKVADNKIRLEKALAKPDITAAQTTEIKRRWGDYFRPIVRPLYIRKRNEAEADRLRGIRDDATLQSFKCVIEVHEFIIQLNQEIIRVLALGFPWRPIRTLAFQMMKQYLFQTSLFRHLTGVKEQTHQPTKYLMILLKIPAK